jgi:hypothetical protein
VKQLERYLTIPGIAGPACAQQDVCLAQLGSDFLGTLAQAGIAPPSARKPQPAGGPASRG